MKQIVILEGHDMVGKSAIGNALENELNASLIKMEKPWKHDQMIELLYGAENLCQMAQQLDCNLIFDRFHPSEYAYSKVFNRMTSQEQIKRIDDRMAEMNALIVVCYKDESAYQFDPDDKLDIAKYTPLIEAYREYATITKCKVLFLNTSDENLENQLATIKQALQ